MISDVSDSDDMITAVLSRQYGIPSVNLELFQIDASVLRLIPQEVAQKYSVLPLSRVGATLTLAMVDPTNVFAMDDIKFMTGLNVEPVVVAEASIQQAIAKYYSTSREIDLATVSAPTGASSVTRTVGAREYRRVSGRRSPPGPGRSAGRGAASRPAPV